MCHPDFGCFRDGVSIAGGVLYKTGGMAQLRAQLRARLHSGEIIQF